MATVAASAEAWPEAADATVRLRLAPAIVLTDDQLLELSSLNDDLRLELTAEGELLIMPPTGGDSGDAEAEVGMQLRQWAKGDGTGTTFSASTGFRLPNGAVLSPDASWVPRARLDGLTEEQRARYLPLCPDFVVEIRSPSDALAALHAKLREYLENGCRLGWLLDPPSRRVFVYRPDAPVETLEDPETVAGDPVLPGFVLDLREVW
jgi:Uma2 family endonuclease